MDCGDVRKHCQPFLDKELQSSLSQEVESHLRSCSPCQELFEAQRSFNGFVKKVLVRATSRPGSSALKNRILETLESAPSVHSGAPITSLFSPRLMTMRGPVAAAAACMFFLTGFVGYETTCVNEQCRVVRAARHEHARIVAGNGEAWARNCHPGVMDDTLKERASHLLKSVPNLGQCHLVAECCGKLSLPGMPEGVYVKYTQCCPNAQSVTLMVIDTPASPTTEAYKEYLTAQHAQHHVISWHAAENGPLYMVVTKLPFQEALNVAEAIRR
ncbi:MAG TPA: zf-HC2 domain-containing protein [Planctomycetota bacterium]|nr:zf-HC2 domain-containing protein [Planctomycetota bacterium]